MCFVEDIYGKHKELIPKYTRDYFTCATGVQQTGVFIVVLGTCLRDTVVYIITSKTLIFQVTWHTVYPLTKSSTK